MHPDNAAYLETIRPAWEFYKVTQTMKNLDNTMRQKLLNIARQEFAPGYLCCLHCMGDVARLLEYVFTQYEKQQAFVFPDDLDTIKPVDNELHTPDSSHRPKRRVRGK